jgi:hypothetical protein
VPGSSLLRPTIAVRYTCIKCGLDRVTVAVPARCEGQATGDWMRELAAALAADHKRRKPTCRGTKLAEVVIPVDEYNPIGAPIAN